MLLLPVDLRYLILYPSQFMFRSLLFAGGLLVAATSVAPAQSVVIASGTVAAQGGNTPPPAPVLLTYAEQMPEFPGGDKEFHKYLVSKTKYPAEAARLNRSGTVYVRFVVDEEGRIRDAEVVRGCGAGLDDEALRLVRLMPWWTPGRQQGQPVRVQRTLPISFRLR